MSSGLGKGKGQVSTCEKAIMGGLVSQIQHGACCAGLHPSYWSPPQLVLGSHRKLWDKSPQASGCWVGECDMNLGAQVFELGIPFVHPAKTYSILNVGSSTLGPLALATPLSFPRCAFCWAELGKVFTSLIPFLPSLPSIPLCFFPFLNHYHNLGFQTGSIRQRQPHGDQITFMCGLNTAHKLLPGKENNNFALEHEEYILL